MDTELVSIDTLSLDPYNARTHSERNLSAIAASLKEFGQRKPIVVHQNVVIAGNGTLEAALTLGWKEIAVTRTPSDWTLEQARAFALADNRTAELAEWDTSILSDQLVALDEIGFDIEALGFAPIVPPSDPEPPEDFPDFDEDTKTAYCCPKCGYEWNGSPR